MKGYTLEQMRQCVLEWYRLKQFEFQNNPACELKLITNENNLLVIEISFEICFVSIIVNEPSCAPYKHIFFQADAFDSEDALKPGGEELIYFFYDCPEMELNEAIEELNYGFELCLNYEPEKLKQRFINQKGRIHSYGKRAERFVHVNDLTKIEDNLWDDEFICKGVQFQYLVLENKSGYSLRVLSDHYEINETNSNSSKKQGLFSKLFKR